MSAAGTGTAFRTPGGGPGAAVAMALLAVSAIAVASPADAQDWRERRRSVRPVSESVGALAYDGRLTFARIRFEPRSLWAFGSRGEPAWAHDYPTAERNFMKIVEEITLARVYTGGSRIVTLDDPDLFKFPIAYLCEPGHWTMDEDEVAGMRAYLSKGGFVIFDDFPGRDWGNFEAMMRRVIPDVQFVPMSEDHVLFHSFFEIETLDILQESYRGRAEFYGVFEDNDPEKRLLAIINYRTDIGEYWEYSATGFMPVHMSNEAYKLGVNYWMYALTH